MLKPLGIHANHVISPASLTTKLKKIEFSDHLTIVYLIDGNGRFMFVIKNYGPIIPYHPTATHIVTFNTDLEVCSVLASIGFSIPQYLNFKSTKSYSVF